MSKSIGYQIPPEVVEGLGGESEARDQVTLLVTVGADQFPRLSLLGRSEVEIIDLETMILALWAGSETTANIRRSGLATMFRVDGGIPRSILLRCADPVPFTAGGGMNLVAIEASVVEVQADEVGYATIVGTLDFLVRDVDEVLPRWREVRQHLSDLGAD